MCLSSQLLFPKIDIGILRAMAFHESFRRPVLRDVRFDMESKRASEILRDWELWFITKILVSSVSGTRLDVSVPE